MMWLIQFLIAWLSCPQNLNLTFAALCVAGALGARERDVLWGSAVLYLLVALT